MGREGDPRRDAAEAMAPGVLLIWIGVGLFLVGVFLWAWPEAPFGVQILALSGFMLVSVLGGLYLQSRAKAKEGDNSLNTGIMAMKGRIATAATTFTNHGRVYVGDSFYSAYAEGELKEGQTVVVTDVRDGVLHIKAARES